MGKVLKLIKTSSVNLMTSPARCTLRSARSLSPALAVSLSFNPFTYIGRAVFQLNSIGFATPQKPMEFNWKTARPIYVNGLNERETARAGERDRALRSVQRAGELIRFPEEGFHELKHFSHC